jgi:hypothetical protein
LKLKPPFAALIRLGIEPILKVEGGGNNTRESNITIRYVSNYELDTDALTYYNNNIPKDISDIQNEIIRNKREIETKDSMFRRNHYHYNKNGKPDTPADNLAGKKTEIRFIPKNTREIIVLPPVEREKKVNYIYIYILIIIYY